jgi:hypothetical protein
VTVLVTVFPGRVTVLGVSLTRIEATPFRFLFDELDDRSTSDRRLTDLAPELSLQQNVSDSAPEFEGFGHRGGPVAFMTAQASAISPASNSRPRSFALPLTGGFGLERPLAY